MTRIENVDSFVFRPDPSKSHKQNYRNYLESPAWHCRRREALERGGHKCQLCASGRRLNVHHNTYARLFNELPIDLCVLCRRCHRKFHNILEPAESTPKPKKSRHPRGKVSMPAVQPEPVSTSTRLQRKAERKLARRLAAEQADATGVMVQIVIGQRMIGLLTTPAGGNTGLGFKLMGYKRPDGGPFCPPSGWRRRLQGKTVLVDEGQLHAEIRRCGNDPADISPL